jgi:hypothetical protein
MFLYGCNYPWSSDGRTVFYGLDFGANVWNSHLGVSTRRTAVTRDFDRMAAFGFTTVRWFVFGDGRSGVVYGQDGVPAALDAYVFDDMDAALEIARDSGIRLVLVALDHRWMFRLPYGRAGVLLHAPARDALVDRVLVPLLHRYGPSGARADLAPSVAAWELMNEPDWVIGEWRRDLSRHVERPLTFDAIAALVARFSEAVHRHTTALATIGAGRARNLTAWDDDALGLDLLQIHHYPDTWRPHLDIDVAGRPAAAFGLTHPLVLGEFPGAAAGEYIEFALAEGYAGAWPWSFSGTDAYGTLPLEPLIAFGRAHPEHVNARFQP